MEEKKKILIVDDEAEALLFFQKMLERHGFKAIATSESREALPLAKQEQPDLVILDVAMPQLDGGDVFTLLESDPDTKKIPIIFLTALLRKEEQRQEHRTMRRIIPILAKPVNEQELLKQIAEALS